ncbi:ABC transporter permease [Clostridiales bacterium PH28_bin88]|nr:ABC transporter permease [Clostridiales bacterium PH28_bin88]
MRLDSIAMNSLRRRKVKMLFLVLGIVVAMGTVVTLYSITTAMNRELADTFDEIGANIMIVPKEDDTFSYGGVTLPGAGGGAALANDDIIAINTIKNRENIALVAPKLLGLLEYQQDKLMVVGVDFPYELKLKRWWQWQGNKPTAVDDLLIGAHVAENYGLKPGDLMRLQGRQFKVAAVLAEQGTEEDGLVFMHLLKAQELTGQSNRLSFIEVAAYCTTCPIEEIVRQITEKLPHARVTALAEAVKARQEVIDRFTGFTYAVSAVIVLIGALVVMLTMMSSVTERTREIGIYRAMGYRRSHVFEIVLTEAVIVGLVGGVLGYLLGMLAAQALGPGIAQMKISIPWNPLLGGVVVIAATGLGVLASAYPATQAAKLDPAEALRFI